MHEFWTMYKKCARGLDDLDLERRYVLAVGPDEPQESPFQQVDPLSPPASTEDTNPNDDDILDPDLPIPSAGEFPPEVQNMVPSSQPTMSFTGPVSEISDDELNVLACSMECSANLVIVFLPKGSIAESTVSLVPIPFGTMMASMWGIIIHGFIRLITGLCASNNNTADTVLELFLDGAQKIYILLPGWNPIVGPVEALIYGEEVSTMSALNTYQLLPEEENLIEEELEVYGIDWQGLRDDGVLQSQAQNNPRSKGLSSWVGYTGPPPDLSEVIVQPPQGTLTADEISHLYDSCSPLLGSAEDADIISLWNHALTHVHVLYPNVF
ncbi:hypothetical protein B0H14DRAFT_2613395 [Mycena olivaceomarginata]|nr:hypothetical protein B0H14DRAFT_2613395 [Mycena olivaceomarginata]